jgi:IS1 family transposase
MNRLSTSKKVAVISALVEGCSIRSTSRMTGVAKGTILRLLAEVGTACAAYHDKTVRGLTSKRIQCDEIWSFVGAKQKNATDEQKNAGWGDAWTWTGMDADTKLMISWLVGGRAQGDANIFMHDVASRLTNRVQLTTDGNAVYFVAVDRAFGVDVDYGQLQKIYAGQGGGRYSPAMFRGCTRTECTGMPDPRHISTSFVERNNLTMRMNMRRFTRLTNAFSKKIENHAHSVALFYLHYNFVRVHQTLRVTPAMEAGIAQHIWSIEEIVALTEPALRLNAA